MACRFVPYDQWFLTHLDDNHKVKQIKLWLLSKCSLVESGQQTQRPVSPITFAPSIRTYPSLDSLDDGYHEDDEYSDEDLSLRLPSRRETHSDVNLKSCPSSQPHQSGSSQYTLLSFSTGTILEDEFTLSWYNLRPYELLEIHPVGIVAPLRRDVLAEYIQPYFQAKVRVLRAAWNHRSGHFEPSGADSERDHRGYKAKDKLAHRLDAFSPKSSIPQLEGGRKTKLDWKARWVVINHGVLSLCKEHVTSPPLHQFSLSTMRALRGADALERASSIVTQSRVVCIKFRPRSASLTGMASPLLSPLLSSPSSSPISEKSNVQEPLPHLDTTFDWKRTTEQERLDGEYTWDTNDAWNGEGEWIILDMLDDHAFSNILRILHRQAPQPISSSFVVSSAVSHHPISSLVATPFASYDTIPYPEWRIHTVENARKAGMGDVGKPMAWVLWTEKGHGETLLSNIRHHRKAFSQTMQYKTDAASSDMGEPEDESDDSEMEWDGWMRDLERQGQIKQQADTANKSAGSGEVDMDPSMFSPIPSPPLSETSPPGSPRARSPSLPRPHLASGSQWYPNIGNVIQASGSRGYRSPETTKWTTVSCVSVGMAPSSRRRSSTLSADMATTTKRERDKGKPDTTELSPRLSMSTARAPTSVQWPSRASVRHAHSSSNLRMSYSLHGSDVGEYAGHAGPSSPSKRQSAFMRGMSVRAGKIVRGLESAIDFVDEKNV